ncbi:MAG: hydroxyisourate hydrolase [Nannocystaceae bacterium]|nr:hydroxyisourate hydrolase [Nannocystaceae bacterium]
MSPITTHVLDTAKGCPAGALPICLEQRNDDGSFTVLAHKTTDADGRIKDLMEPGALEAKTYRMTFDTGAYYRALGEPTFYPSVTVLFEITAPTEHHHVPLLLSPFGYSTYRGS